MLFNSGLTVVHVVSYWPTAGSPLTVCRARVIYYIYVSMDPVMRGLGITELAVWRLL